MVEMFSHQSTAVLIKCQNSAVLCLFQFLSTCHCHIIWTWAKLEKVYVLPPWHNHVFWHIPKNLFPFINMGSLWYICHFLIEILWLQCGTTERCSPCWSHSHPWARRHALSLSPLAITVALTIRWLLWAHVWKGM